MSQYFENDNKIKSQQRIISTSVDKYNFSFYSDNGVFSKNEIDEGSRILIETFLKHKKAKNILDVGGGIGIIAIILAKILDCQALMVEVNERAIELASKNIEFNHVSDKVKVIKSDAYEKVSDKYDVIITNPPIRAGKAVVYKILLESINYLLDEGELWFVIRKNQGALSAKKAVEEVFSNCEIINRDKGFYILRATKGKNFY